MPESLPEKLAQGARAVERRAAEITIQGKPFNLYDLLQINFGQYLDELLHRLSNWKYDDGRFQEQLDLHRQIVIYFNSLGIKEFDDEDLNQFSGYHQRLVAEAQINFAQQTPVLLQQGSRTIDLELRVIETDTYFEPDHRKRASIAEKFVARYLASIGGEERLTIEAARAALQGFRPEETFNGRYYLLLMFKHLTMRRIIDAKKYVQSLESQVQAMGGRLDDEERRELDTFVRNLHQYYSPPAYNARFEQYKREKSFELLKQLKPLP